MDREAAGASEPRAAIVARLAWLVGFLAFFYSFALPNHPGVSRIEIWSQAPFLLLDLVDPPVEEGGPPSGWRYLPQRFDLVLVAGVILAGAWGLGQLVLRAVGQAFQPDGGGDGVPPGTTPGGRRQPASQRLSGKGDRHPPCSEHAPPEPRHAGASPLFRTASETKSQAGNPDLRGDNRWAWEAAALRTVFAFGLGLSALSLVTLGFGLLGWLSRTLLGGVIAVGVVLECGLRLYQRKRSREAASPPEPSRARNHHRATTDRGSAGGWPPGAVTQALCLAAVLPFLALMLLGAMSPPTEFDVREYHLQGPKEFYQAGRVGFLPHNVYASFPFLTEMLSLLAMVLRDDWFRGALAGKLVLMTFAPLTALALYAAARRWFGPTAAAVAVLVHLSTPWTYRISVIAYAEGGLTFYLFAGLLATMLAVERVARGRLHPEGSPAAAGGLFLLAGLMAGSAMACKYPAAVFVVVPLGLAVLLAPRFTTIENPASTDDGPRTTRLWQTALRPAAVYALGVCVTVGPWLIKNAVETGNPVYPLMDTVLRVRAWDDDLSERWRAAHRPPTHDPRTLAIGLIDATARNDWHSPLLFGLAPLALLTAGRRRSIRLAAFSVGYALLAFVAWRMTAGEAPHWLAVLVPLGLLPLALMAIGERTPARWLWLYAGWCLLAWWLLTHRIDRFWVPVIPVIALLAGAALSLSGKGDRLWQVGAGLCIAAAVVFNLAFVSTPLAGYNVMLGDLEAAREFAATPGMQSLNERLPPGSKVLFVGDAEVFDARFPHVYNTVFNRSIFEDWTSAGLPGIPPDDQPLRDPREIRETLRDAGITHVYVNWQEILRYRLTYGFTEFVAPPRFDELQQQGVLGPPVVPEHRGRFHEWTAIAGWESLSAPQRREIEHWAPELVVTVAGRRAWITAQLYPVVAEGR